MSAAFDQIFFNPEVLPYVLLTVVLAALYGVFIGSIPGLTATMAVALLVPITYEMEPIYAIAAVVTMVASAIFAGDIPNTLLRIPGTPSSAAYTDDVYALTQKGQQNRALGVCLVFSVAGGLFGSLVLMFFAQYLARVAREFGVVEYFWLYLLGLGCAVVASRGSALRGAMGLVIGLVVSTIGLSTAHGTERFTFGLSELYRGISFIPAMIGLFGMSEVFRNLLQPGQGAGEANKGVESKGGVFEFAIPELWRRKWHALRSGAIGSTVGMLPGAGADIAAWVSLGVSRRLARGSAEGEAGALRTVGDATAANNSSLAGAWVPALVFGIPGDSITALVIGILLMKDVTPGPAIFERDGGALVFSIYIIFILANLVLIPVGYLAIKAGNALVRTPRRILLPVIVLCCVVGSFALRSSYFDVGIMLAMGMLGFALDRWKIPLGPVVLGIVLGAPLEDRFIGTLTTSEGSFLAFFERPFSMVLGALCLMLWLSPAFGMIRRKKKAAAA